MAQAHSEENPGRALLFLAALNCDGGRLGHSGSLKDTCTLAALPRGMTWRTFQDGFDRSIPRRADGRKLVPLARFP